MLKNKFVKPEKSGFFEKLSNIRVFFIKIVYFGVAEIEKEYYICSVVKESVTGGFQE